MTREEKQVALDAVDACYDDAREMFDALATMKDDKAIVGEHLSTIWAVLDTAEWMASSLANALWTAKRVMREQIKEDEDE
ncbi:MAG: hypothetical protein LUD47_06005 [Clostridia bacterium]|nr:hypothetical protein [Clostridia bacterium]